MSEQRTSIAWITAPLILISQCGVYVGGYFYLCEELEATDCYFRFYKSEWEADFFKPATSSFAVSRQANENLSAS